MVRFPLLSLLLLGSVEEVTASALLGRQHRPSDDGTRLALNNRQQTTIFSTFSAIFREGDASRPRTALRGYEIRVDVANSAWGFCATNNPTECDMAGACFDSFSCSTGCGSGNTALVTWRCRSDVRARYCSTDLLTLSSDSPSAVTYLACGDRPNRTQLYKAFTTPATTSTSPSTAASPPPTSQTSSQITSTSTGTSTSQTALQTSPTPTPSATSTDITNDGNDGNDSSNSSDSNDNNNNNNNNNNSNDNNSTTNTAMIVGASVGCVALVCISVVIVFLIRRNRGASAATAAAAKSTTTEATTAYDTSPAEVQGDYKHPARELHGEHAVFEVGQGGVPQGWGREYPAMSPVELSGTAASGWEPSR